MRLISPVLTANTQQ